MISDISRTFIQQMLMYIPVTFLIGNQFKNQKGNGTITDFYIVNKEINDKFCLGNLLTFLTHCM